MQENTIVAPMTHAGVSAVSALRVSGPDTRSVLQKIFHKEAALPRRAYFAKAFAINSDKEIDSLLFIYFEAPHSYTGEDTLEIFPHGNPLIVKELIQNILKIENVRLALPGEFTKRAFLNGKLDLVQAASVGDLIHSKSIAALENAKKLLSGKFSEKVQELSKKVLEFSARVELDVDFSEEEDNPDTKDWPFILKEIQDKIDYLLTHFREATAINKMPLVVIYGKPNAGKSSLINALLEEDRLLVSSVPGTTRDFIEVRLFLPGGEIRLIDTAGLSENPVSELDALSMKKSRKILEEADLKIHLIDAAENIFDEKPETDDEIIVYSKTDKVKIPQGKFGISSKTKEGLKKLSEILNNKLFAEQKETEDFWITSERERLCLESAKDNISRASEILNTNFAVELIAFEMQMARKSLQSITGEISSETILQSIFAGFCIGK